MKSNETVGKRITSKDFVDAQVVHEWCLDVWHGHPLRPLMDWYSWNTRSD